MSKGLHLNHTLREDLIKDILIWSGAFVLILGVTFVLTLNSLASYMLSEMVENRMSYQTEEFAKHLSLKEEGIIDEESDALIQGEALSAMIVIDASGLIAHISLHEEEPPVLAISADMTVMDMRKIVASVEHLRLFEANIPGHEATLAMVMDVRPVLKTIYTSTLWTFILLLVLVGISILILHYSLKRHLIDPIDEVKHLIEDDVCEEEVESIMSHLPDEVALLAHSYEDSHKSHEVMKQQFFQAQKMEAIGTLVGGIAHDFNNMLAGMMSNLYMVKKDIQEPDMLRRVNNIEELSIRAADMIQQLLTFARKGMVNMKVLPLTPFMKDFLKFAHTLLPENIEVKLDVSCDSLHIYGDSTQLHQVMMNLIANAKDALVGEINPRLDIGLVTFKPDKKFLETHVYFKDIEYAHLSIADNGQGIRKATMEHIFEPFFTTKEVGRGTGLGLSMVFGAIKTHAGFVEVESDEGKGSVFHLYLPLVDGYEPQLSSESSQEELMGKGETVLIVDDESFIRDTSREVLENLNDKVLDASNGLEAVEVFKSNANISLVIMDVVMPQLGGVQAAELIKGLAPDVKIIFFTGYDKEEALANQRISNDSVVLSKPLNIVELSKAIRGLLD